LAKGSTQARLEISEGIAVAHQTSRLLINPDGSTVHAFDGDEDLIYRACTGDQCVFCGDEKTAQAHLSDWRIGSTSKSKEPKPSRGTQGRSGRLQ